MITATVTGKLGQDVDLRTTKSGKTMAKFSVASSQKKGEGYETTWVDVLCFDEMADTVSSSLAKGDRVVVTGRMNLEKYEKKDGSQGASLCMMADEVAKSLRFAAKVLAGGGDDSIPAGW